MAIKWYGDKFADAAADALFEGMQAAGLLIQKIARTKASVPNTGQAVPVKRQTKGGNKTSRTIYPHPSKPPESPRRRTGVGQKNIVYGHNRKLMLVRIGYTRLARYMTFHELGIRYKKKGKQQRPTLIPAIRDNLGIINTYINRGTVRAIARSRLKRKK